MTPARHFVSYYFSDTNWQTLAVVLVLTAILSVNIALAADERIVRSGVVYNFSAQATQGDDLIYLWTATGGSPTTSSNRTFRWTAPIADSPGEVTITLMSMSKGGCKAIKELKIQVLPYIAALSVSKTPSVAAASVGDTIIYTFTVKNTGNVTVDGLTLSDTIIGTIALTKTSLAPGERTTANASYIVTNRNLPGPLSGTLTARATDQMGKSVSNTAEASVILSPAEPRISIKKDCIFTAPVMIGKSVTYTYNVTNRGGPPLMDINLTDLQNWGPNCLPIYQKGDDGNGILDPEESWWYECRYAIPDPSDYPQLHVMASTSRASQMTKTIQSLMEMKSKLEIMMADLRLSTTQFDTRAASQSSSRKIMGGVSYTFYNYSNTVTAMSFSKLVDPQGNLNETIYIDPLSGAMFTVQYAPGGMILSEELFYPPPGIREYLKIEYDKPTTGYKTVTVIDYRSGDTLILIIDSLGNIVNEVYKITPGYMLYTERYFLKNTVTVTAKTQDGKEVSDSDLFTLEVFRPLPLLSVTKYAESGPVNPGGTLNYTIVYENTGGSDAHDVMLQETYGSSLAFIWSDRTADSGTTNRWTLGDLKIGESGKIRIETKVSASAIPGSVITNQVELTSSENTSAKAAVNTTVSAIELNITKMVSANFARPGDPLNYTIVYGNTGNEDAHEVVVRETYDKNLEFQLSVPFPDNGTSDRWTLGDLKAGQSGEIKIYTIVRPSAKAGQLIKNVVDLTCRELITAQASNYTTVAGIELNITKTASAAIVEPGSEMTYTINYRNDGSMNQTNVVIDDYLDPNVDLLNIQSDPPLNYSSSGGHYTWHYPGDLAPKAGGKIEILAKLRDKSFILESVHSIFNTYKISSSQAGGKNATLETLVVHSLWIKKSADKGAFNREENITYTINYGNMEPISAHDVSITDLLPEVDLISASPAPNLINGNTLTWVLTSLGARENGTITIVVQIPKKPKAIFSETSYVTGDGYVYARKGFSTEEKKESLKNRATISGYYDALPYKVSSTSIVTILGGDSTKIKSIEHGSGHYSETAKSSLIQENKSVSLDKDIFAKHRGTTFSLPGNRTIRYNSLWSDLTSAENKILSNEIGEKYQYVDTLNKSLSLQEDMNQTVYNSEGYFSSGMAQISSKKYVPDSKRVLQEIDENYHGSFKVNESVDYYGESAKFAKSAIGKGFVYSDKRVNGLQGSSEQGSGYYSSVETSELGSVDKYTKAQYAPVNLMAGSQNLSYANLWNERMWTKYPEKELLISEQILHAHSIDKETLLEESSLSTMGKFNGTMNIQMIQGVSINLEQTYVGSYQMDTAISVFSAPKHLYPHVNISKEAIMLNENTVLFLINVSNDGNKIIKPLNVTDRLPDGLSFINSSIRAKVNGQIINWSIPTLDIGRTLTIKMRAKVDGGRRYYKNIVSVKGVSKDRVVEANNSTSFEAYYLPLPGIPRADLEINTPELSSVTSIERYWGDWNPSPCFNMTSNMTECSQEMDSYYDELEKNMTADTCASNYNVP